MKDKDVTWGDKALGRVRAFTYTNSNKTLVIPLEINQSCGGHQVPNTRVPSWNQLHNRRVGVVRQGTVQRGYDVVQRVHVADGDSDEELQKKKNGEKK